MAKEFKLKNPDAPMTYKQGLMIRNAGGGDVRDQGLTMQEASDRIGELMAAKGGKKQSTGMSRDECFQFIYDKAVTAGKRAGDAAVPSPMVVSQHENAFDDNSPVKDAWLVSGGVCGFAWVNIKPGTSAFAKWLKKNDYARPDTYYGGVTIWVSDYNQSMTRKEAHAAAMAKVFTDEGFKAYSASRMD